MAGKPDEATQQTKAQSLTTMSTDRRKLIGQAIIDGLLTPAAFLPVASDPDYNQGQGGYTQKGGDHKQGGGDYNQSQMILDRQDLVTNVIREILQKGQIGS
jgi:hypothetical protein